MTRTDRRIARLVERCRRTRRRADCTRLRQVVHRATFTPEKAR